MQVNDGKMTMKMIMTMQIMRITAVMKRMMMMMKMMPMRMCFSRNLIAPLYVHTGKNAKCPLHRDKSFL